MSAPPRATIPKLSELVLDLDLETARLALRPWTASQVDIDAMYSFAKDPEFPKLMSWAAHTDPGETRAFLESVVTERLEDRGVTWAIIHDGQVVGSISLTGIRWQFAAWRIDRAELGYWLAPKLWNTGLMTEAAHQVLLFGFDTLGLHKITTGCFEQNVASRRVIEKLGFRHVGRHEDDVWRDGRWHTQLRYELTAAEWSDVSTTMPISISRPRQP